MILGHQMRVQHLTRVVVETHGARLEEVARTHELASAVDLTESFDEVLGALRRSQISRLQRLASRHFFEHFGEAAQFGAKGSDVLYRLDELAATQQTVLLERVQLKVADAILYEPHLLALGIILWLAAEAIGLQAGHELDRHIVQLDAYIVPLVLNELEITQVS